MTDRIQDEWAALVETVETLRGPDGCPWDRQQTHQSLKKYAVEEVYEALEAIDSGDPSMLEDELGDVLLQVLLHAEIAREAGQFDVADVCRRIREKLQRRHPHVFGDVEVSGVSEVLTNWEQIKSGEPGYDQRTSALDGVPKALPALMRAAKLSKKAARTGFDWPHVNAIFDKLKEETQELEEAVESGDNTRVKEELGDLLFTAVNIARHKGIDPEEALRDMLERFTSRFNAIEDRARETGREISDMSLEEMDNVWDQAKRGE
ncbi:MAG: nucleoside triphosphate pyrophosphohydrolase [Armatimonadota bacterium]|nr:nucleoside triphosphate pyrophosphohydrolase [bacterium]